MKHSLTTFLFIIVLQFCSRGQVTYEVFNVTSDDSLNVRVKPDSKSPIINKLPHNTAGITVLKRNVDWVKIKLEGQEGWVNSKYLKKSEFEFEEKLICFGNEPYWKIDFTKNIVTLKNERETPFRITHIKRSSNNTNVWSITADNKGKKLKMFIVKESCSDDMSDNEYTYKLYVSDEYAGNTFNGCCNEKE